MKDEFELREMLATLKCWHRLTRAEEDDLLRFAAAQREQEPLECLDCGSHNVGIPATYQSLVDSVKAQPAYRAVKTVHEGKPVYVAQQDDDTQGFLPDWANFEEGRKVGRAEADEELTAIYGLLGMAHLNLKQHLEYGFNPKTAASTLISVGRYYPRLKAEMEKS